jgi:hypothetical protein
MRKIFIFLLTLALVVPSLALQAGTSSAVTYLKSQTPNEWITMALVAGGESSVNKDYLKTFSGPLATDYAKRILAIVAVGENPRTFAGTDLVQGLKDLAQGGQIGDTNLLNDDAWGILALRAAGVPQTDTVVMGAKDYLLAHQETDGGWGYAVGAGADTNDTVAVLMALQEVGLSASDSSITAALQYLHQTQNSDGGFPYVAGSASDSGSTSWVLSALQKYSQPVSEWTKSANTPANFLNSLQLTDGSYKWQASDTSGSVIMTAFAVVALTGKYYPVSPASASTSGVEVSFRIEGSSATICQGNITAITALEVVVKASSVCNFTYHVQISAFGQYLDQIAADKSAGTTGWLYLVNWQQAQVGAADYNLQAGDQVLWFFGEFTWRPLRLSLSQPTAQAGQSINVKAESFVESKLAWQTEEGVVIKGSTENVTTNTQGEAAVIATSADFNLVGEGVSLVRSAKMPVLVGESTSQTVALDVNIEPTVITPPPPTTAFTISSTSLSFGNIKAGQETKRDLTITNTGAKALYLGAIVNGDEVFTNYLKLNQQIWSEWQANLTSGSFLPVNVIFNLPSAYNTSGHRAGHLVFWATAVTK